MTRPEDKDLLSCQAASIAAHLRLQATSAGLLYTSGCLYQLSPVQLKTQATTQPQQAARVLRPRRAAEAPQGQSTQAPTAVLMQDLQPSLAHQGPS